MIKVKNQITRKRPKSLYIELIQEIAPWVLISQAAEESGLTELQIRKAGITLRKFGNADYVKPEELNAWIIDGGKEKTQS